MRPLLAAGSVAGFILLCGLVAIGGRSIADQQASVTLDEIDDVPEAMFDAADEPAAGDAAPPEAASTDTADDPSSPAAAESGPSLEQQGLERVAPREPLSELSQALPPGRKKPVPPDEWKSTRLFNTVAASAGVVEAQGYRVALAGVEPTAPDEECSFEGKAWPCGAQARTAFRAWLRARAVQCVVPPEPDRQLISAECSIGKEDVGAWLVASGWARAVPGGPYAEAGSKAEADKKGLFGAPPKRISVTLTPGLPTSSITPSPDQPILNEPVEAPAAAPTDDGPFPLPPTPSQ